MAVRNRWLACEEIGVVPLFETVQMDDDAILEFVFDENLHRRHLNSSQRACVAVNFLELEKTYARQRMSQDGKKSAPGRPEKGRQLFAYLNRDAGKAAERAAKKVGTNRTSVHDAAKLKADDPEAFQAISKGKKTVSQVKREKVEQKRTAKRTADAKRIDENSQPRLDWRSQ